MSGVGSSPTLDTCETSQVLLAAVSGGFHGVLPFRPTYGFALLDMSEDVKLNKKKNLHTKISIVAPNIK